MYSRNDNAWARVIMDNIFDSAVDKFDNERRNPIVGGDFVPEFEPSSRMAGGEHAELPPKVTTMAAVPSAFAAQADADQHFAETATAFPAANGTCP
jgi:hypothetical protein